MQIYPTVCFLYHLVEKKERKTFFFFFHRDDDDDDARGVCLLAYFGRTHTPNTPVDSSVIFFHLRVIAGERVPLLLLLYIRSSASIFTTIGPDNPSLPALWAWRSLRFFFVVLGGRPRTPFSESIYIFLSHRLKKGKTKKSKRKIKSI